MQENKKSILSTRPLDSIWIDTAAADGIELEAVSFIETKTIQPDKAAEKLMDTIYKQSAIVIFTSMNAADAVASWTDKLRKAGNTPSGWRIFCIGHATRQRVIRYFGENAIAGTADSALALADKILGIPKEMDAAEIKEGQTVPGELFFFCGDQRRDELPDRLREKSVPVREIVVYHTISTAHTLHKKYDGILFFSPSAVEGFFLSNSLPIDTLLFAIGPTTAAAIKKHAKNPLIISESPSKESLVRQAIDYFADK